MPSLRSYRQAPRAEKCSTCAGKATAVPELPQMVAPSVLATSPGHSCLLKAIFWKLVTLDLDGVKTLQSAL